MNTEEIKTQFVIVMTDIIDIYEKTSKFTSKDIDTIITNVTSLNKKNMLLKKMYDLEEDISKLKMLIIKSNLLSSTEQKEEDEKIIETDPQHVNEEKEDKKVKVTKKKEEKVEEEVMVKEEKKVKVTKKKEEKVDEEVMVKEEKKVKVIKNKEEKVESPKINEVIIEAEIEESNKSDTGIDESQQPLHIKRKKIPKQIKTLVWNEYIGHDIMSNKCLCCKKEKIDIRNFHCGHVIAESKGGDLTIKNLRPICAPCNLSMGSMSMNEFTKTFFGYEV